MLEYREENLQGISETGTPGGSEADEVISRGGIISDVKVIGGGLAGSEAALTLARSGISVELFEMRPGVTTPAHRTGNLAELVCSNSFGSRAINRAKGLLLAELEMAGASLPEIFAKFSVPAGQAFAVDAGRAGEAVSKRILDERQINLTRAEVTDWPDSPAIIATGPLTSEVFMKCISTSIGSESLHFFDAISPSVYLNSIDLSKAFFASRYDKGGDDYLNIPLNEDEYNNLVDDLLSAERAEIREYEPDKLFEGCLPIEVIAERGRMAPAFGPLKPRGLDDPATGRWPFAVIQLRRETLSGEIYNFVGFQTRLKHSEQKRILTKLPALKTAKFSRFGTMHLNSYIEAPRLLNEDLSLRNDPGIYIAGQLGGGEGYLEAIATGFYSALNLARKSRGLDISIPPPDTMSGAFLRALTTETGSSFKPVQVQFGLMPEFETRLKGRKRNRLRAEMAIESMTNWLGEIGINPGPVSSTNE